jgi:hypothetical protein
VVGQGRARGSHLVVKNDLLMLMPRAAVSYLVCIAAASDVLQRPEWWC